jgi:formate dehydrogenase major subunit
MHYGVDVPKVVGLKITEMFDEATMKARVAKEVKPGILYTTFHFPEIMVNYITGNSCDEESLCPEFKVVAVNIEKA